MCVCVWHEALNLDIEDMAGLWLRDALCAALPTTGEISSSAALTAAIAKQH